jgi:Transglycosylase SLT domain
MRNEPAIRSDHLADHPLRPFLPSVRPGSKTRTIVVHRSGGWQSLALLCLCLLLIGAILLAQQALRILDRRHEEQAALLAAYERRIEQLEAGIPFETKRRQLMLGMRDHILRVNPRISLSEAYRYAELVLQANEKYPTVDPLLLLAIGTVESRYDPRARSTADARGLYQIWPSTGRLLLRTLGWSYDDSALYDPEKNTQAAALYLDILFSTYTDPQLVLAEYNGGPLNAGYFRAGVSQLAAETRNYVPQVLEVYGRLKQKFASLYEPDADAAHLQREGRALGVPPTAVQGRPASRPAGSGNTSPPEAPAGPPASSAVKPR